MDDIADEKTFLTVSGRMSSNKFDFGVRNKYLSLVKCILEHEVFYKVLGRYFELSNIPDKQDVCDIMRCSYIYGVSADSHNTIERRAQTVLSWVDWILGLQN